jgi:hypothetical protein
MYCIHFTCTRHDHTHTHSILGAGSPLQAQSLQSEGEGEGDDVVTTSAGHSRLPPILLLCRPPLSFPEILQTEKVTYQPKKVSDVQVFISEEKGEGRGSKAEQGREEIVPGTGLWRSQPRHAPVNPRLPAGKRPWIAIIRLGLAPDWPSSSLPTRKGL